MDNSRQIRLRLSGTPTVSKLTIEGEHLENGNLHIRVEVPRKVNLGIQMPAGQVNVDEIVGDKDIKLYAGQITVCSAHLWDYKDVDVSVGVGQVNATAYGVQKSGFFRDFKKENPNGEYRLYVHVITGQIDLLAKNARTADGPQ